MPEPYVILRNIAKTYGDKSVLHGLNLEIGPSEMVALLGPSGCGKSTTLKILAGLETPDSGEVLINGKEVSNLPTRKRNLGIVFQAYSLFPHMNAIDNVAYGLKTRGVGGSERRKRADELIELVGLNEHAHKYPAQMSGGQQQRVALARALAVEPEVLLLDEPLSALDAKVRVQLREEIRRIQLQQGISTLMVTHDQEEALVMADRIGVMNQGEIAQIGNASDIYRHPQSPFISSFVGATNRLPGIVENGRIRVLDSVIDIVNSEIGIQDGDVAVALVRPEEISLRTDQPGEFIVMDVQLRGAFSAVVLQHETFRDPVRVDVSTAIADGIRVGQHVYLGLERPEAVVDTASPAERAAAEALISQETTNSISIAQQRLRQPSNGAAQEGMNQ